MRERARWHIARPPAVIHDVAARSANDGFKVHVIFVLADLLDKWRNFVQQPRAKMADVNDFRRAVPQVRTMRAWPSAGAGRSVSGSIYCARIHAIVACSSCCTRWSARHGLSLRNCASAMVCPGAQCFPFFGCGSRRRGRALQWGLLMMFVAENMLQRLARFKNMLAGICEELGRYQDPRMPAAPWRR